MRLSSLLALAAVAAIAGSPAVDDGRRCACCRMPSNRCPCRHCGACSTSGGVPGPACACGRRIDDEAGEGERSPRGGSPAELPVEVPP